MPVRKKRSISLPPDLDARIEAAALAEGVPVSAWLARSAQDRLIVADGLAAMAEWRAEHGDFPAEVVAEANEWAASVAVGRVTTPKRRRSA